jgi:hypothetical protein
MSWIPTPSAASATELPGAWPCASGMAQDPDERRRVGRRFRLGGRTGFSPGAPSRRRSSTGIPWSERSGTETPLVVGMPGRSRCPARVVGPHARRPYLRQAHEADDAAAEAGEHPTSSMRESWRGKSAPTARLSREECLEASGG